MSDLSNQLGLNIMQVNSQILSGLGSLNVQKTNSSDSDNPLLVSSKAKNSNSENPLLINSNTKNTATDNPLLVNQKAKSAAAEKTSAAITKNNNRTTYATKGEYKYSKDMDTDNDGVVTYSEYIKSISDKMYNQSANTNNLYNLTKYSKTSDADSGLQVLNINNYGKALRTYINASINLPTTTISAEG